MRKIIACLCGYEGDDFIQGYYPLQFTSLTKIAGTPKLSALVFVCPECGTLKIDMESAQEHENILDIIDDI